MGLIHRVLNITAGLAAGYLACKMLENYNKDRPIEGEFLEVVPQPDEAGNEAAAGPISEQAAPQPETVAQSVLSSPTEDLPGVGPAEDLPNTNPVEYDAANPSVMDATGKLDPTRIADSADFANWDELGCQS